ncbi:MAG TPA: hypothetical protein VNV62_21425, partial [Trebonia sp.]|nr:hypothetical protein [Trebonia sp.]
MARGQRKQKLSAKMVEDEDYQLTCQRCAGIDVAKASGVVCVRLPPQREGGKRVAVTETFAATVPAILELAAWLAGYGVAMVSMESTSDYVRCEGAWVSSGRRCWRFGLGRRRSTRASARWPVSALACAVGNC